MIKRLVMTEPLLTFLDMLDDPSDQTDLIGNLVNYGLGKEIDKETLYNKVRVAFEYLTSEKVRDEIFIEVREVKVNARDSK